MRGMRSTNCRSVGMISCTRAPQARATSFAYRRSSNSGPSANAPVNVCSGSPTSGAASIDTMLESMPPLR